MHRNSHLEAVEKPCFETKKSKTLFCMLQNPKENQKPPSSYYPNENHPALASGFLISKDPSLKSNCLQEHRLWNS